MNGKLVLEDNSQFEGDSFGAASNSAGEMVFATGMTGYPESFTDPSYAGQILVLTYPLIGNYGIPDKKFWESDRMHIAGLIVSNYIDTPSHFQSKMTLGQWLKDSHVPALEIKDTRFLAQKLRDKGAMLGKIVIEKDIPWYDPNKENVLAHVSTRDIIDEGKGEKTVILIDCGAKMNMRRNLLKRGLRVVTVPWNYDPFDYKIAKSLCANVKHTRCDIASHIRTGVHFDALIISNGPGDPKMAGKTIETVKKSLENKTPTLGICLGNQLLALAAGGDTAKLKFGHRSQNQPCIQIGTNRCFITTQNHGFAVNTIPKGFKEWFRNANDGSNEGLIHEKLPFMSVQFHPESTPGPYDTEWIFDYFLKSLR